MALWGLFKRAIDFETTFLVASAISLSATFCGFVFWRKQSFGEQEFPAEITYGDNQRQVNQYVLKNFHFT